MIDSWNVVLNTFIKVKYKFIENYNFIQYYYDDKTCIEKWIEMLNDSYYVELIKPLQFTQFGYLILIRYANYSEIGSEIVNDDFWNKYDGFYKECRSLVIDIKNEELILTPFKKFRNLDESQEMSFENISNRIQKATCVEFSNKLDGSMQSARYYNNQIIMSGSQSLDKDKSWRLNCGYEMLLNNSNYCKMLKDFPYLTFIFEFISLRDEHIVKYNKDQEGLYLIGVRSVVTGDEYNYYEVLDFAKRYDILTTCIYNLTLDDVISQLDSKQSFEAEGFVLNIDGYKVKIKYNDYLKIHKIKGVMLLPNVIIKNIADNTFDDLFSKIPTAYKEKMEEKSKYIFEYLKTIDKYINDHWEKTPTDKKEFMIFVDDKIDISFRKYFKNKFLNKPINYLKSGNDNSPHYKTIEDIEKEMLILKGKQHEKISEY